MTSGQGQTVRKTPCASCPYRRDVPSGVWAPSEYAKLLSYDGEPAGQALAEGGLRIFGCHQGDGQVCAGWAGHRDQPADLLAIRIGVINGQLDPSVLTYRTSVPLFATGAEAAEHGMRDCAEPSAEAVTTAGKIIKVRDRRGSPLRGTEGR